MLCSLLPETNNNHNMTATIMSKIFDKLSKFNNLTSSMVEVEHCQNILYQKSNKIDNVLSSALHATLQRPEIALCQKY